MGHLALPRAALLAGLLALSAWAFARGGPVATDSVAVVGDTGMTRTATGNGR